MEERDGARRGRDEPEFPEPTLLITEARWSSQRSESTLPFHFFQSWLELLGQAELQSASIKIKWSPASAARRSSETLMRVASVVRRAVRPEPSTALFLFIKKVSAWLSSSFSVIWSASGWSLIKWRSEQLTVAAGPPSRFLEDGAESVHPRTRHRTLHYPAEPSWWQLHSLAWKHNRKRGNKA